MRRTLSWDIVEGSRAGGEELNAAIQLGDCRHSCQYFCRDGSASRLIRPFPAEVVELFEQGGAAEWLVAVFDDVFLAVAAEDVADEFGDERIFDVVVLRDDGQREGANQWILSESDRLVAGRDENVAVFSRQGHRANFVGPRVGIVDEGDGASVGGNFVDDFLVPGIFLGGGQASVRSEDEGREFAAGAGFVVGNDADDGRVGPIVTGAELGPR